MATKINPVTHAEWLEQVRRLLAYDPDSGRFTWLADRYRPLASTEAGNVNKAGYRVIVVAGRRVRAHRLAWLFVHGELPPAGTDIDHINGRRSDNRIINLRICSRRQNLMNARAKGKTSKFRGVCFDRSRGLWLAQIKKAEGRSHIGRFATEIEAARAYDQMAARLFGEFARLNFPGEIAP